MTMQQFVDEYNEMVRMQTEELTDDILAEIQSMVIDMMTVNVGEVVPFELDKRGRIILTNE